MFAFCIVYCPFTSGKCFLMSSWRDVSLESSAEDSTVKVEVQEHKSNGLITKNLSEEEEVGFSLTLSVDRES